MNYRLNKFFAAKNYAADATEVIDLNMKDVISNIILKLDTVNVGDANTEHPMAILTKIELVDCSDVLYSLNGFEAEALDWYDRGGRFGYQWNWALTGMSMTRTLAINFGRYLWDKEYAFDPTRFKNPQLRVSIDYNAGGNAPSSVYLTAWANLFETPPAGLRGFFMSKEIKQYTAADGTHDYTDLPLDYPIRGLYIQPFLRGTESVLCIENIKLSEDQDKAIPFNDDLTALIAANTERYPKVMESYIYPVTTGGAYLYIAPSNHVIGVGSRWEAASTATSINCYDGDGGKLHVYGSASANVQIDVSGDLPHSVAELSFGRKDVPEEWYDIRGLGNLKLDITGNAASVNHIFLQQVRGY